MNPAPAVKTLLIDGNDVSARADQTILDAARENDVPIPTLVPSRRIERSRGLPAVPGGTEGLESIATRLRDAGRRGHGCYHAFAAPREVPPHDSGTALRRAQSRLLVCVSNNMCQLQDLAKEHGVTNVRFPYRFPKLSVDVSHERFAMDHNRCILCTRCVRVCNEIEGAHTWDVLGRGVNSLLISDLEQPWGSSETCTSCGKCVQVCPTGALFDKSKVGSKVRKDPDFLSYLNDMREGLR